MFDSTAFLMPMFFGIFFVLFALGAFCLWFFVLPLLYLWTDSPNRILSSIFCYVIWSSAIVCTLLGCAWFFDNLLEYAGFREGSIFAWNMSDIRSQILIILIGIYFFIVGKKFLPMSIFDPDKKENKNPVLYASHAFHMMTTGILIFLDVFLLFYLADWLLKFGLIEPSYESHEAGLEFFINFVSVAIPATLLGIFLLPSFHEKKQFIPKMKSETCSIFQIILFFFFGLTMISSLGMVVSEVLMMFLLKYDMNANDLRPFLIALFFSSVICHWSFFKRSGGTAAFVRK